MPNEKESMLVDPDYRAEMPETSLEEIVLGIYQLLDGHFDQPPAEYVRAFYYDVPAIEHEFTIEVATHFQYVFIAPHVRAYSVYYGRGTAMPLAHVAEGSHLEVELPRIQQTLTVRFDAGDAEQFAAILSSDKLGISAPSLAVWG